MQLVKFESTPIDLSFSCVIHYYNLQLCANVLNSENPCDCLIINPINNLQQMTHRPFPCSPKKQTNKLTDEHGRRDGKRQNCVGKLIPSSQFHVFTKKQGHAYACTSCSLPAAMHWAQQPAQAWQEVYVDFSTWLHAWCLWDKIDLSYLKTTVVLNPRICSTLVKQ